MDLDFMSCILKYLVHFNFSIDHGFLSSAIQLIPEHQGGKNLQALLITEFFARLQQAQVVGEIRFSIKKNKLTPIQQVITFQKQTRMNRLDSS